MAAAARGYELLAEALPAAAPVSTRGGAKAASMTVTGRPRVFRRFPTEL